MATQTEPRAEVEQVLPGIYRIGCPFGDGGIVHVYYLDAPEPAIIDTGVSSSPPGTIQPALAAAGFDAREIRSLFNTHGHWDHMGGNAALRALAPHTRTYAHAADAPLFASLEAHLGGYTTYPARLLGDRDALARQQAQLRAGISVPTPVEVPVKDGQVISLGGDWHLRVVHTPGHSLGSTSYLLEHAGALFTGDSLQGLGSRPGQLPLVFDDSRAYRATIVHLSEVPFEVLCLGHSFCGLTEESGRDPVRRGAGARRFLEESGEAAKAIEEAMRSAVAERPGAGFLELARTVLATLAAPLGLELDAAGLNVRSLATLHAFYRELTGAPLPA